MKAVGKVAQVDLERPAGAVKQEEEEEADETKDSGVRSHLHHRLHGAAGNTGKGVLR